MGTTTTRTTLRIFDKTEYLVNSIRTHMAAVSLKLSLTFGALPPRGGGDPPRPDWAQVQQANLELLEQGLAEAHQADQLYRDAKVMVSEAFSERDKVKSSLQGRHRGLRTSIRGVHSKVSLAVVGLEAPASPTSPGSRRATTAWPSSRSWPTASA